MSYTYNGHVALVTGGTGTIGQQIVKRLVEEKIKVAFTYFKQEQLAQVLVEQLGGQNQVLAILDNETSLANARAIVEQVRQQWGAVDYLVNNTGLIRDKAFMNMDEDDWKDVLAVNLEKAINYARAIIFEWMKVKRGAIINVSSIAGLVGSKGQVNYSAAKAGLFGLTKALAREVAGYNIRVNAIAPGYIESTMTDSIHLSIKEKAIAAIPMARFGQADELAGAIAFLLSQEAAYMTGQTVVIDGGLTMV